VRPRPSLFVCFGKYLMGKLWLPGAWQRGPPPYAPAALVGRTERKGPHQSTRQCPRSPL